MKMKNKIWGVALVMLALFYAASQFIPGLPEISIIKILISVGLITIIIPSISKLNFGGVLIPSAIIMILFEDEIAGYLGLDDGISGTALILAAIVGSVGLNMIFADMKRQRRMDKFKKYKMNKTIVWGSGDDIIDGEAKVVNEDGDEQTRDDSKIVKSNVVFSSSTKYINSQEFEMGDFECNFGELKLYFDKANIVGDRADVKIECNFANMILYVPKGWKVNSNVALVCAGIKEKGEHVGDGKTLYITGEANFGSVTIIYV